MIPIQTRMFLSETKPQTKQTLPFLLCVVGRPQKSQLSRGNSKSRFSSVLSGADFSKTVGADETFSALISVAPSAPCVNSKWISYKYSLVT